MDVYCNITDCTQMSSVIAFTTHCANSSLSSMGLQIGLVGAFTVVILVKCGWWLRTTQTGEKQFQYFHTYCCTI